MFEAKKSLRNIQENNIVLYRNIGNILSTSAKREKNTLFLFYRNIFYKNIDIKAKICEISRTF